MDTIKIGKFIAERRKSTWIHSNTTGRCAAYVEMPIIGRILIIILVAITAFLGIGAATILDVNAGYYECPHCNELFIPTTFQYVKGYHTLTKRWLTCPKCGKSGMCKKRITR